MKTRRAGLGLSLMMAVLSVPTYADVKLSDNAKILGKWVITAEALGLEKEKKALDISWEFKSDGTLATRGEDTLKRTKAMDIDLKYSVENGVIKKQAAPGREKYEDCAVVEIKGSDMVLKCKNLYLFLTRQ